MVRSKHGTCALRRCGVRTNSEPMAKKKIGRKDLDDIERAAKRKEQKEAGALDGRFRPKVVPNKKRKPPKRDTAIDEER